MILLIYYLTYFINIQIGKCMCDEYYINLLNNTVLSNSLNIIFTYLGISNIIDMPTIITQTSQSSLGNILTNCSNVIQGIIHLDISEHSLILCIFNNNLFINKRLSINIHEILINKLLNLYNLKL